MPRERGERPAGTREALPGTFCGSLLRNLAVAEQARPPQKSFLGKTKLAETGELTLALKNLSPVGQHLTHRCDVGLIDLRQLLELAHALGRLGAEQVTLARMHPENLAIRGDLETLFCAAMGLQFQFWFRRIPWHRFKYSLMGGACATAAILFFW